MRHLSSVTVPPVPEAAKPNLPNFWVAPPLVLPKSSGTNRVNWDLRYDPPPAFTHTFEINANPGSTPASPEGPVALPGVYTFKLTVDGRSYTQTATVHNDPRSPATAADLRAQHALLMKLYDGLKAAWDGHQQAMAFRAAVHAAVGSAPSNAVAAAVSAFDAKLDSVAGSVTPQGRSRRGQNAPPNFVRVNAELVSQLNAQDNGDMAPTPAMLANFAGACRDLTSTVASWNAVATTELASLNRVLARESIHGIPAPTSKIVLPGC